MLCTGEPHPEATPVRIGASFGLLSTRLRLGDGTSADLREQALAFSVEVRLAPGVGLMIAPGGVLGGSITSEGREHSLSPGPLLGAGVTWRVVDAATSPVFVMLGGSLSASRLRSYAGDEATSLTSIDARVSATAGKTFADRVSPYLAARAFGGPVFWSRGGKALSGTDAYHYSLGAGVSLLLPRGIDAFGEAAPLGERRYTFGLGATF